ncbi:MAG: rhombosortase [Pontiellaceae bacterium]|nr:rhombosortase [Pontiellaceae bacterium]MBN2785374.1 rhombosortase [Pontiellaceae bacterium]
MKQITNHLKNLPPELWVFTIILLAVNSPLLFGRVCDPLIFRPEAWIAGEWWRAVTFPFVHVSLYHLLLDSSAFLYLYHGLGRMSFTRRGAIAAGCTFGSLIASLAFSSLNGGLCGLSGIAHGLMAVSGLELAFSADHGLRRTGWMCLAIIIGKSLFELLTGQVLFAFLHLGSVGAPVAATHFGGVAGGLASFALISLADAQRKAVPA